MLLSVILLSPFWVSILLSKKWQTVLASRTRFIAGTTLALLTLGFASFFIVYKLVGLGVEYWYLEGNPCEQGALCSVFDFLYISRGVVSLMLYALISVLWLRSIRNLRPRAFGFTSRNQSVVASSSERVPPY